MLLQARPSSSQAPLQIVNVEYGPAVDTFLLDIRPEPRSGLFGDHGSAAMKCGVAYIFDAVLYIVKVVASFWKVQYEHKIDVVCSAHVFFHIS